MHRIIKNFRCHSGNAELCALILLLITVLWTAIYVDLRRTHASLYDNSQSNLSDLTLAFGNEIESSVKTIDMTLLDLRQYWRGDLGEFAAAVRQRQAYLEKDLAFQVAIIGRTGLMHFSSLDQSATSVNISDREHFRVHQVRSVDQLFISTPVLGRVSKRWSIQFTRPIWDKDNKFAGVIVLSVAPEYFSRFHRISNLPDDSVVVLVRDKGEILSRFPQPVSGLDKIISRGPYLEPLAEPAGIFRKVSEVDGRERLYSWRTIAPYKLTVTIGRSFSSILAPYAKQRSTYIASGTAVSLLLLLVGYMKLLALIQENKSASKLAESEERWRTAIESAGDGVWDWNVTKGEVVFSDGWKAMLGFAPDEIGSSLEEWKRRVHPDDMEETLHKVTAHLNGETKFYACEHRLLCKDRTWKWILDRGGVIRRDQDGKPERMIGTHTDISARKTLEEVLSKLATTDALTELSNRRHFIDGLRSELARVKRYPETKAALLMIDIDYFKNINDTYGHAAGDAALMHLSSVLRSTARQSDFAGRLGGEEFGVLLIETDLEEARQFAERFSATLRTAPFKIENESIIIAVSIGLTLLKATDASAEESLNRADVALYQAKEAGRDRVVTSTT